jgi:drug/metabolite transporter (DMT)-like permease
VRLGVLLTAAGAVAYGLLPVVLGTLYREGVTPEAALVYRYAGSVPPLALLVLWRRPSWHGALIAGLAGLGVGAGTIFLFRGYARLPASLTVLIFYTYPAFALVLARLVFGVAIVPRTVAAIAMVIVAALLILGRGEMAPGLVGVALATFGAPAGYGLYLACLARLPNDADLALRMLAVNVAACAVVLPLALSDPVAMTWPATAIGWLAALYMPAITGIGATALIVLGASLAGGARAGVAGATELVTVLLLSWIVLGESFRWGALAGALLILAAIGLSLPWRRNGRGRP